MLLQMFELLNKLKDGGANLPKISFRVDDEGRLQVKMYSISSTLESYRAGRTFTGQELLLIPLDDGGQLDRMAKAFLIDLKRVRKDQPA